jgi:transcriptional regulator of acetoin/glycerol metabolism
VTSAAQPGRPEIELSWKRSRLSGIEPDLPPLEDAVVDVDPGSHLLKAAAPVLQQLAGKLRGTHYSLLMADRDGRLVYRWFDDPRLETVLDGLGIRAGASSTEETLGTNAIGTALETRRGIAVHGAEHFIEPFKGYSCYGHPIISPVSRRLEGVLDISGAAAEANPLLAPLLVRAVEDIELRLLDQAKTSERLLLAAFQAESRVRSRAVAALGEDMLLTNKAAVDLLGPGDCSAMRFLVDDLDVAQERKTQLILASGLEVDVHLLRVAGACDGTLFRFQPAATARRPSRREDTPTRSGRSILIHGPVGSGRTTEARRVVPDATYLNCADATTDEAWARRLRVELGTAERALCLENIDLLPDALAAVVVDAVAAGRALVATSGPVRDLTGSRAALAAMLVDQRELATLQERAAEIGTLAMRIVHELDPAANIRLVPSVVDTLANRAWPGNLHELRAVMIEVLRRRTAGDVTVDDLPEEYRTVARRRALGGRERAERAAIVEALKQHGGNKVRAAEELGISRTTLYARMRALKVIV